jgi:hypothetical protein
MSGLSNDSRFSSTASYFASATSGGGGGGSSTLVSPVAFTATPSTTVAALANSVASGGSIVLGSSTIAPAVLTIADTGANTATVSINGGTGADLLLAGATPTAPCQIATNAASGAGGVVAIGSSPANPSGITVSDTAVVINKLGGAPVVLLAIGSIAAAAQGPPIVPTNGTISLAPCTEGLWCVVGTGSGGTSTQNTADAQFSTLMYVNSAGVVEMGGSVSVNVGTSLNSADQVFELYPLNGATTLGYTYTGGQQLTSFGIYAFKISGPIPGTV